MIWPAFLLVGIIVILVGCWCLGEPAMSERATVAAFIAIAIGAILVLTSVFLVVAERFSG